MQRAIDGDDIADLDHVLDVWMPGNVQFFFHRLRQPVAVIIVQMHIEGFQAFQHGKANAAGGDGAGMHAFDVIGALDAIGDVPAALHHPLIGRNVIATSDRIIMTTCSETLIELQKVTSATVTPLSMAA